MSRLKLVSISAFSLLGCLFVVRLLLPYELPEVNSVLPESIEVDRDRNAESDELAIILRNNVFSEDRRPLVRESSVSLLTGEVAQESGGNHGEPQAERRQLLGVSRIENMASIKIGDQVASYVVGDELPDGSRLEEVFEYGVRISLGGEDDDLYLFGKK